MRYLREKIDRPFGVESIETVRGAGYRLRADGGAFAGAMALLLAALGLFIYLRFRQSSTNRSTTGCARAPARSAPWLEQRRPRASRPHGTC